MIRDRRDEDLGRLVAVLERLERPAGLAPGRDPREWLTELDAAWSWVFDQAPVAAAPTRNVIGHLQVHEPSRATVERLGDAGGPGGEASSPMAVGRFFVAGPHAANVARFLLTQAVERVRGLGRIPVVDLRDTSPLPASVFARRGFVPVDATGGLLVLGSTDPLGR